MPDEMSADDRRNLFNRKVGWHAHNFGLGFESDHNDVLDHDRKLRAKAQDLPEDANWYQVFCAELKAGIDPPILNFCEELDIEYWYDDPCRALDPAREAHKIFYKKDRF